MSAIADRILDLHLAVNADVLEQVRTHMRTIKSQTAEEIVAGMQRFI